MSKESIKSKEEELKKYIKDLGCVTVAFSSGVDSTYLLKIASDVLNENVLAITVSSSLFPQRELNEAIDFCKENNIKHEIIYADELNIEGFKENPKNRCYICKYDLFSKIIAKSQEYGIANIAEASNMDDLGDYRPGLQAVNELGAISPLRYCKLYKDDIRALSKDLGLYTYDKPSFACLASRFVYGQIITKEKLKMVELAENYLMNLGLKQFRVRIHDNLARIEVYPEQFDLIIKNSESIYKELKGFGFSYITLDLIGFRSGSMNEILSTSDIKLFAKEQFNE